MQSKPAYSPWRERKWKKETKGRGRKVLERRRGEREGKDEARQKTAVEKGGVNKRCKMSSRWRK
jgi:hypothetical protein